MKNPSLSLTVFGVYLLAVGAGFIFIPNLILPLLGLATTTEVWVRVVGLVAWILAMYFLYLARPDERRFMRATVYARVIFFTGISVLVLAGFGSPILIAFGLIDLAGATWTWYALRATQ